MPPIVPPGALVFGMQLPVQAQSKYFVEDWELSAGPAEGPGPSPISRRPLLGRMT